MAQRTHDGAGFLGYLLPGYCYQVAFGEGLNSTWFAESYRTHLGVPGDSTESRLLPQVRRLTGR